jgi:NAD-dependent dihydropyrimidine dehydrogenase PreA subunit
VNWISWLVAEIFGLFFRLAPLRIKPGLYRIGTPDENAPVLVTGNYRLTVARLWKRLRSRNLYLLVADSGGINVWCASAGGRLTHHQVLSVLKTSRIEERVNHRRLVLPQLSATGIDGRQLHQRSGWHICWGPVYARDIPAFLDRNFQAIPPMRRVEYPLGARIEMALCWAFSLSFLALFLLSFLWPQAIPATIAIIFAASILFHLSLPLFRNLFRPYRRPSKIWPVEFESGGLQTLILLAIWVAAFILNTAGSIPLAESWKWALLMSIVLLTLTIDLPGSTPILKSGTHEDRHWNLVLDGNRCQGTGICREVCPMQCFDWAPSGKSMIHARPDDCIRCGACVVQCPVDALFFLDPEGNRLDVDLIRYRKVDIWGRRNVHVK